MRHFADFPKVICAVALFACSISYAADGVTTTQNGLEPSGARFTLALQENLRIGPDKGDHFLWTSVGTTVQADDQGNMYVCDPKEKHIAVIDANGNFVRYIGGPGQGPGEFQALGSFQVLADGRGVAFEGRGPMSGISLFDKSLNFVENAKLGDGTEIFNSAAFAPNGQLFFAQVVRLDPAAGKMIMGFVIKNRESEQEVRILDFDNPMPTREIMQSPDNFAKFLGSMMKSPAQGLVGFATFDADGNFYTATAKNYEITRWNSDMKKDLVITRKYKPIPLSEEELQAVVAPICETVRSQLPPQLNHLVSESTIAKAIEIADFPPAKHPVNGLGVLEDGTLCVVHEANLAEQKMAVDLFDRQGHYLGNFTQSAPRLNSFALVFKNGQMYRIESNADDEYILVRYSYKLVPAA